MRSVKFSLVAATLAALTACGGGGGGGGSTTTTASTPTSYQAVATEGELISYEIDTTARTYAYTVIESAYGKTGATGSGSLTVNSDGTYTPSGFNGKIAVLDSGLLLGAIYEDLNGDGTKEVIPVIGVSDPVNSLAEAEGTYNFISRQCGYYCTNYFGTVKVNADGSWTSCVGGNLAATYYSCQSSVTGGASSVSAGRATLTVNGTNAGSMLIFKDATTSQKAILLDLNGQTNLGKGAVFASTQSLPANADGRWTYIHTNGTNGAVTVSGTSFTDSGKFSNGTTYGPIAGTFTKDVPWNGFITTDSGALIMPTGSGLYAGYFGSYSTVSIGVKK